MSIKAVIFDLDDTLVVEKASAEAAIMATCSVGAQKYDIDPNDSLRFEIVAPFVPLKLASTRSTVILPGVSIYNPSCELESNELLLELFSVTFFPALIITPCAYSSVRSENVGSLIPNI